MKFKNSLGNIYELDEVIEILHRSISENRKNQYKVIVGTDSQRHGIVTVYITVVVLHQVGKGGRLFYHKRVLEHGHSVSLSTRLLKETEFTVRILQRIEDSIVFELLGKDQLSGHVDVGRNGDSAKVLEACVGWITSLGFECASKPDAFVATHVADKYAKKRMPSIA